MKDEQRKLWDTLREKVIDQEISLVTSPNEAVDIALTLATSIHGTRCRAAVSICGVNNIRIVRKIVKATDAILGRREGLSEAVFSRTIPSIVLLAAIHYGGIEDGPDVDFVLARGTRDGWGHFMDRDAPETDETKLRAKWNVMLTELGIVMSDEFEMLVVDFLRSGWFDRAALDQVVDRYIQEADATRASEACRSLGMRLAWDPRLTDEETIREAEALLPRAALLDPYQITHLNTELAKVPGGGVVGDSLVTNWIDGFRARHVGEVNDENPFGQPLHPDIKAAFDTVNQGARAKTGVVEALAEIVKDRGWGTRHEFALKSASVEDFETILRTADMEQLRLVLRKMIEFSARKDQYLPHFGSAMDHFVTACRNIRADPHQARLGRLLQDLFDGSGLASMLRDDDGAATRDDVPPAH